MQKNGQQSCNEAYNLTIVKDNGVGDREIREKNVKKRWSASHFFPRNMSWHQNYGLGSLSHFFASKQGLGTLQMPCFRARLDETWKGRERMAPENCCLNRNKTWQQEKPQQRNPITLGMFNFLTHIQAQTWRPPLETVLFWAKKVKQWYMKMFLFCVLHVAFRDH